MASVLRIALGRCSCTDAQPDPTRQAICRELMSQLNQLRSKPASELEQLPPYAESEQVIAGRKVTFETIVEPFPDAKLIIVKRAFSRSLSRPNWISFQGIGHMFADGFVVQDDGSIQDAPDEWMWDFR
jgi:hypothetical protein